MGLGLRFQCQSTHPKGGYVGEVVDESHESAGWRVEELERRFGEGFAEGQETSTGSSLAYGFDAGIVRSGKVEVALSGHSFRGFCIEYPVPLSRLGRREQIR